MPNTPKRAYPYPPCNVTPNVPYWIQQLAVSIENDVSDLTFDTGWLDLPVAAGWVVGTSGARYRRKANVTYMQMHIDAKTWGSDALVATLPTGFRPKYRVYLASSFGEKLTEIQVNPDGRITAVKANTDASKGLVTSGTWAID